MNFHGGNIYNYKNIRYDFSANINPLGVPDSFKKALMDDIDSFTRYPDIRYADLKDNIRSYINVPESVNILVGNGAVEIIYSILGALDAHKLFTIGPTFSEYKKAALNNRIEYDEVFATDIGNWEMEITNTEGNAYKFRGSLCANFEVDGVELSDLIRDSLQIDDLYVFDGRFKPDKVNRITVDYHRVTKIKPKQPISEETEYVTWDYTEQLIVDRELEIIEHTQNIGTGCIVSHKYKVEGGVEGLLDDLDADYLFDNVEGNPPDIIDTPNETKEYTITIDFNKNPQRVIRGTFDKNGLPDDFADFAETVFSFMRFYGFGEILDSSIYGKVKRHKNDYIFCSVTFDEGYKSYYYITDDDSIEVGDSVLVPAGKDNHTAIVEVVNIEYFSEKDTPLPVEKTKHIIRKCTDDDFDQQKEV